jgi:NAD(P)-dependent dehydrogenase (short-subunit alcohol dehydrogenase family)
MRPSRSSATVLVTGCGAGLGRFTAGFLRARGWHVVPTARTADDVASLQKQGFPALRLDLNSSSSIAAASEQVSNAGEGVLHGVVHNAGIEILGALEDMSRDDLRACFETNVFGALELTARLMPRFRRQDFGRIVFISSSNSNGFGYPFMGPGNASKCALECLATTLKRELAPTRITVSTVCPGELPTAILSNMLRRSEHLLASPRSNHAATYQRLRARFSARPAPSNQRNLRPVAEAVDRLLDSESPARRVVVPFSAAVHYLSHLVLPEWLQDKLLDWRMKKDLRVHV